MTGFDAKAKIDEVDRHEENLDEINDEETESAVGGNPLGGIPVVDC